MFPGLGEPSVHPPCQRLTVRQLMTYSKFDTDYMKLLTIKIIIHLVCILVPDWSESNG